MTRRIVALVRDKGSRATFARNVTLTFFVHVFSLLLGIATSAIIARQLGPEGKGVMNLALLLPGMLGLFLSSGIGVANVYFVSSRRLNVPTLTANSTCYAMLSLLAGVGIMAILVPTGWLQMLVPGVPIWIVLLTMLALPIELLRGYFNAILQGLQRIIAVNIVSLAQSALALTFTFVLVLGFQLGVLGAVLSSLMAGSMGLMSVAVLLRREGGVFRPRLDFIVMRSMLSFGLRGHVGNVLQFFNYRLDLFVVNYFLGPTAVGIYSVSVRLAELLWYLPNAVGFVLFPKAAASKPEALNVFTPRILRTTLVLTALGALGLALLGRPVIQFIYSFAFIEAYVPMLVLLPGVVLLGGSKVLTNEIAGRGYPHYNSITSGLGLILTLLLDLLFIPQYGIVGASLASSLAYTVIFFAAATCYRAVSRRSEKIAPIGSVER